MKPKRLTEKTNGSFLTKQPFPEMINKLGQLEDIEEWLGIDLLTLFKALKKGIYSKGVNIYGGYDKEATNIDYSQCFLNIKNKTLFSMSDINFQPEYPVKLKDYGKTWALTKEELQK